MTQLACRKHCVPRPPSRFAAQPLAHSPPPAAKPSWRRLLSAERRGAARPGPSVPTRRRSAVNAVWAESKACGCGVGPARFMANLLMDLERSAEHSPAKCRKYTAVLSVLTKESENRFQDCGKNPTFGFLCASVFLPVPEGGLQESRGGTV